LHFLDQVDKVARYVALERGVRRGELCELVDVLRARTEAVPFLETAAEIAESLEDLLGALAILPELRLRGFGL
jgi:hypothetical protein